MIDKPEAKSYDKEVCLDIDCLSGLEDDCYGTTGAETGKAMALQAGGE